MKRDKAISILKKCLAKLQELGVCSLALFGSVGRDEATTQSDVDILVEFDAPLTFDRYMDVKFYLEDSLETRVDLVTEKILKPLLRDRIVKEVVNVP